MISSRVRPPMSGRTRRTRSRSVRSAGVPRAERTRGELVGALEQWAAVDGLGQRQLGAAHHVHEQLKQRGAATAVPDEGYPAIPADQPVHLLLMVSPEGDQDPPRVGGLQPGPQRCEALLGRAALGEPCAGDRSPQAALAVAVTCERGAGGGLRGDPLGDLGRYGDGAAAGHRVHLVGRGRRGDHRRGCSRCPSAASAPS